MKLVQGQGSPETGACWMSAIAWYVGEQDWTDAPECVDPTIRSLAIWVNDSLQTDEERERRIGPVMFNVIGTRTDDDNVLLERRRIAVRFAARCARTVAHLDASGKALPAIEAAETWADAPCYENAANAAKAAYAAYAAYASAAYAAKAAYASAAKAASNAAYASHYAAYAAASASKAASAAHYAAYAAMPALIDAVITDALETIAAMAAIGTRQELPQARELCSIPAYAGENS